MSPSQPESTSLRKGTLVQRHEGPSIGVRAEIQEFFCESTDWPGHYLYRIKFTTGPRTGQSAVWNDKFFFVVIPDKIAVGGVTTVRREVDLTPNYRNEDERAPHLNEGARIPSTLPDDSAKRKQYPVASVMFGQFPAAIMAVAHHSWKGNNKHNPGKPLQDNRSLSNDDEDCILRHLAEGDYEGVAWRSLRLLQKKLEAEGAPVAPLATFN
jgi:hypothetical protein